MSQLVMFAGAYDNLGAADADYEALNGLHDRGEIGSYDSAIVSKDQNGKVTVTKTEKPVKHGAWVGLAAGAAVGLIFPPALPGVIAGGAAGAGVGAWVGHLAHGTSRSDAKELGATLEEGKAALIAFGGDTPSEAAASATEAAASACSQGLACICEHPPQAGPFSEL